MISGSYTGGISFFKGQGEGKYAAAKKLLDKTGKPLSDEYAQTPCLADWDGDGDLDMAVGFISGPITFYRNEGKLSFAKVGNMTINGKEIQASDGGPCLVDWDQDGVLDMLVGDGEGGLNFYKGKAKNSLDFSQDENATILPKANMNEAWQPVPYDPKAPGGINPKRPGVRTKPYACDWNSDGKLDLLVGDFFSVAKPGRILTSAEKKQLAALKKQQETQMDKLSKASQALQDKAMKEAGLKKMPTGQNKEEMDRFSKAFSKVMSSDKSYQKAMDDYVALNTKISKLQPQPDMTGVVWVYLRK